MKFLIPFLFLLCVSCARISAPVTKISPQEIYFRFDSDRVSKKYEPLLNDAIQILQKNPKRSFILSGHTDKIGPDVYNLDLADRRSRSVKAYFLKKGVDPDRLLTVTFGEKDPQSEVYQKNRRVMIEKLGR